MCEEAEYKEAILYPRSVLKSVPLKLFLEMSSYVFACGLRVFVDLSVRACVCVCVCMFVPMWVCVFTLSLSENEVIVYCDECHLNVLQSPSYCLAAAGRHAKLPCCKLNDTHTHTHTHTRARAGRPQWLYSTLD